MLRPDISEAVHIPMTFVVQHYDVDSGGSEPTDRTGVRVRRCGGQLILLHL